MQAYLARRLLALIPALFFASLIVFVIVRLVPGSIIDMMLAQNDVGADKLSRDQLIARSASTARCGCNIFTGSAAFFCMAISAARSGRTRRCANCSARGCRSRSSSA